MGRFQDLRAQFDPVNQKRKGDQFELVCKWFLENDTGQYKQLLRKVWLWKDWPGNWGIDAGIDIVAEDVEGRCWAIQAKAYENTVTRSEVNKFLAEASRFDFAYRMLIATTDKLSSTAQKTMEDLGVTFLGLAELEEFPDWPARLSDLRPNKPPKPKKPWDYQRPAVNAVVKGFDHADRGQLIMACGTGKTLTAWFIREKLTAERTLVLLPSLSLLKQTMKEWRTANPNRPFKALPVCSDDTVRDDDDTAISHISYLGEPAETDPEAIAAFLRKRSGPRVVFSTYQSSPEIAEAFKCGRVPAFDLVIADEAHRVAGPVSSDFATVLDSGAIKARRRLFMTATPRYFTGRIIREAKEAEDEIASMDDLSKFGEVFHRLSFGEAIRRNLLTDYQVAIIGVDDATYLDWTERGVLLKMDDGKRTDARSLAGQIGLAKAMRKYDLRRTISFHGRVKSAKDFANAMQPVLEWMPARQRPKGRLWAKYVSGEMSAGERHVLIQYLKGLDEGERGLLANARCLAEGVDVPALDGVAFIDPRRSEVDIVQAVGRAIRKSDSKTVGTIVIPVFIAAEGSPSEALNDSAFKPVWDVVKALRSHDDELGEELDSLRRELGRRGAQPRIPSKIKLDFPTKVSAEFARAFRLLLVELTTASWEFWFGLLQKYCEDNGTARVPAGYAVDGHNLGSWVITQRHRASRLSNERKKRLGALPHWSWDPFTDDWEEGFGHLGAYVKHFGGARVPQTYKSPGGYPLGAWVGTQRNFRRQEALSDERCERLEQIHPTWAWDPFGADWDEGFNHLSRYVGEKDNALVPSSYTNGEGFQLGDWIVRQRQLKQRGKVSPERQKRLEGVHPTWTWNTRDDYWELAFLRLQEFVKQYGHARVPKPFKMEDGFKLGTWVFGQRGQYSRKTLSAERKKRLEQIHPTWTWDVYEAKWEEGFDHLTAFVTENGHARIPQSYKSKDGFNVGQWVDIQRRSYAAGRLSAERKLRLERSHPTWSWLGRPSNADLWKAGVAHLSEFVKSHGHARVPSAYKSDDGFCLGAWVGNRRRDYRAGKLEAKRQKELERLHPTWSWGRNT